MKTIKFNAEYADEVMDIVPNGYIDKTVPGCGLTTLALENNVNTILAVPNVELIDNKVSQYPNKRSNKEVLGVKEGVTIDDINDYVSSVDVIKIMVTYDSIWKVSHLLSVCKLIIDESQEILKSQKLKASSKRSAFDEDSITTLLKLAEKYKENVSFISATPIPLEYMPSWISELEQVKIEWSHSITVKPVVMQRTYVNKAVREEIIKPLETNGSVTVAGLNFSKVVIFINSISGIVDIVKKSGINKNDVRVIAGKSVENDVKLKGLQRLTDYSNLTKYTFITGSGFKGIDLIDHEAINIVVSSTSKDYNMIDLTTDLQQAISRIRTKSNPNYGRFIYIFNQSAFEKSTEELLSIIEDNKESVKKQIRSYELNRDNNNVEGFRYDDLFEMYTIYNKEEDCFIFNDNLYQADKYFILETKNKYRKGFQLKGKFNDSVEVISEVTIPEVTYKEVAENYIKNSNFIGYENQLDYIDIINATNSLYGKTYTKEQYAKEMIEAYNDDFKQVTIKVRNKFKTGERYTNKTVKWILQTVYNEEGINRRAKSTDLREFMTVKDYKSQGERGLEIINKNKSIKH